MKTPFLQPDKEKQTIEKPLVSPLWILSGNLLTAPWLPSTSLQGRDYYPQFTNKKIEASGDQAACTMVHTSWVALLNTHVSLLPEQWSSSPSLLPSDQMTMHMQVLCKLERGVQMVVYVGDRKSQEGQFPGYSEKRISGFYSEHSKDTSSPFGYIQKALSCCSGGIQ